MIKIKHFKLFFPFLLLLFLPFVFADYDSFGNDESKYNAGTGFFTTGFSDYTLYSQSLSDSVMMPLASDLDGDGDQEIVIYDEGNELMNFYGFDINNGGFVLKESVATGCSDELISMNIEIFDYDDDGDKELIYVCNTDETVKIMNFDGENASVVKTHSFVSGGYAVGESMVYYKEYGKGLLLFNRWGSVPASGQDILYAFGFNDTDIGVYTQAHQTTLDALICFPLVPSVQYEDADVDGTTEYIISFIHLVRGSQHRYYIERLRINADLSVTVEDTVYEAGYLTGSLGQTCADNGISKTLSSPLTDELRGSSGLETVIAYMTDANHLKMKMYDQNLNNVATYPAVLESLGELVSNVVLTKAFDDTDYGDDFCVMGYDDDTDVMDILCASQLTSRIPKSEEYKMTMTGYYDVDISAHHQDVVIHSGNYVQTVSDDVYEFLTTYGIFQLDPKWLGISNDADLIFTNPINESGRTLFYDLEGNGNTDLIVTTDDVLWYVDDGFTNSWGYIDTADGRTTIDPCLNSVWQVNTTVGINIEVDDVDGDNVCAQAILYQGTVHEKNGTVQCGGAGSTFFYSFIANVTGSNYVVRLIGYDVINNATDEWHIEDRTFNVDINGVEYGECETEFDFTPPDEANAPSPIGDDNLTGVLTPINNNSISNLVTGMTEATGLGGTISWLLIMFIVGVVMIGMLAHEGYNHTMVYGVTGATELILLIIGVLMGFISHIFLIVLFVLGLASFGIWISSKLTASGGG